VVLICNLLAAILLPLGSFRAITSLRSFENALLAKAGQQSAQLRAAEKIEEVDVFCFS